MKPKQLITIALLAFVGASVVAAVARELLSSSDTPFAGKDRVVAVYFHGDVRCTTCRTIEAYAHEAITGGFADQLDAGTIDWQTVNYEKPGNKPLAEKYGLIVPTIVLVSVEQGTAGRWVNLDRVWELVGDQPAFMEYVQTEVRAFSAEETKE